MEEEKTIDTSETWTEVKENQESTSDKFEVSEEQYKKLQELERNKTKALQQEREERKKAMERLSELEAKEKEAQEKEMKKKGKYEELLSEKEELVKTLQEKAEAYDKYMEEKQKQISNKIEDYMSKIPKETIEEYSDILEDLKDEKKVKFLEKISWTVKKDTFDPETKDGEKNPNNKQDIDIENAKKGWFDNFLEAMIKNNL